MKARRERLMRIALGALAALILGIGVFSCFGGVMAHHDDGSRRELSISLMRGSLNVVYADRSARSSLMSSLPRPGWTVHVDHPYGPPMINGVPVVSWQSSPFPSWWVRLPLWLPLLLLGAPAAWKWWKHVRRPPYVCVSCGYDLRGVEARVCPECGLENSGEHVRP